MDDRQPDQARKPQSLRFVTERQLRTTLDESLWQVERLRVDVEPSSDESGWRPDLKGSAPEGAVEAGPRVGPGTRA